MATKAQVTKLAAKLGVTVDDETSPEDVRINLTAPDGLVFIANYNHTAVTEFMRGEGKFAGNKADGWEDALDTLKMGLEKCETPDCDFCRDQRRA